MIDVGEIERKTQRRVVELFKDRLGYHYLGNWSQRPNNSNFERELTANWLRRQGCGDDLIERAFRELEIALTVGGSKNLYSANEEVYGLLRYGVKVSPGAGLPTETVWLIDWTNPARNDFAIAEEVTVAGPNGKRPDIVLYVNGIALGMIELKRTYADVGKGIRQSLDSQKKEFIEPFFSSNQLVMAGNDTQGLRYGVIQTPERYWLTWKEEGTATLDGALEKLCRKERLLEIIRDFIVFDAGVKKTCRHHQYFGVHAAQEYARRRQGGIVWHTQGSGKSLTMVWLAKWILENITGSRVLIITDRDELDKQIEKVFLGVNEQIYRTTSGADLIEVLNKHVPTLICSLIHKFGGADEGDVQRYLDEMQRNLPDGFRAKGELFVLVDECHRSQSGDFHRAMHAMLPNATLIGFTGTPLLKVDKQKSIEVFGPYIHTYKFNEAVHDKVVLDLLYEARDIDQHLSSPAKVDAWFAAKTKGLTDFARAQLKTRWGTLQKVLSSEDRLGKIVDDIMLDMATRPRLMTGQGNAILVTSSIYSACRIYELFQSTDLARKCAIVTSYKPSASDIKGEDAGEGATEKLRQYEIYRKMLAAHFDVSEDAAAGKADLFETEVRDRFLKQPGQMKLLIVVDMLLTGFDAPPATYLYIDKQMRDHGLFQAICRVNRLDGDDKDYGYIVDYKDLFKSVERSLTDYTSDAFDGYAAEDVAGLLENRLEKGRERLDDAREAIKTLCEPAEPPKGTLEYIRWFCGSSERSADDLKDSEPRRIKLYAFTTSLLRAYANIANEMEGAGYTETEVAAIKAEIIFFEAARKEVMVASGDKIDLKQYEPGMRHLLDAYVRADDSEVVSKFNDMTLLQLIVERGPDGLDTLPPGIKDNQEAMAESIENNIRRLIIDEMAVNPAYYEEMSQLLDALIKTRKQAAVDYKAYLDSIVNLAKTVTQPEAHFQYPEPINSKARLSLYENLNRDEYLAVAIDDAVRATKRDGWIGNDMKGREVRNKIRPLLPDQAQLPAIFEIVKKQDAYR